MIVLDTNVLLRFVDSINPDAQVARDFLFSLRKTGEVPVIVPQNL